MQFSGLNMDNDHVLSIYTECAKGLMSSGESINFRFYGGRRKSVTIDNAL